MKNELQKRIFDEFDEMFSERHLPMSQTTMCWGLEVGDGWFDLIYDVCKKIKPIAPQDFKFEQVKEKFGQLEMYVRNATDEIHNIINKARKESLTICEECGKEGKLIESSCHWFRVRCNDCWEKIPSEIR